MLLGDSVILERSLAGYFLPTTLLPLLLSLAQTSKLKNLRTKSRNTYKMHVHTIVLHNIQYFRYRYEMSNCLFEAAFEKILEDCKCAPGKRSR
jgi:hypothetical protein